MKPTPWKATREGRGIPPLPQGFDRWRGTSPRINEASCSWFDPSSPGGAFSYSNTYLLLTPLSRCCIGSRAIFKPSRRPGYPLEPAVPSGLAVPQPPPKPTGVSNPLVPIPSAPNPQHDVF